MPNVISNIVDGVRRYTYDHSKDIANAATAGRNSALLAQRDATICTSLTCDNIDYMPLEYERCPSCGKKVSKTTKQQEPPYVRT